MKRSLPLTVLPLLLVATSASAFTVNVGTFTGGGTTQTIANTGWQVSSITFDVDSSCASSMSAINAAVGAGMDLWNNVPTANLTISFGTTVTLPQPLTNYIGNASTSTAATTNAPVGNPIIVCDPSFGSDTGLDANSIPGIATAYNMTYPGARIQGALLVLNTQSGATANINTLSTTLSAQVLAHEIGHDLGLGHSADTGALMYYQASSTRLANLAQDDMDGLSYLYPRQEPSSGKFFGCSSLELVGAGTGAGAARGGRDDRGGGGGGAAANGALAEFAALLLLCFAIRRGASLALGQPAS